jgi:hypothetical protein
VLFAGAWLRKIRVVVLYIGIGSAVPELAGAGWVASCRPGRLFLDGTFVFVAIVMFDHGFLWMIIEFTGGSPHGMPLPLPVRERSAQVALNHGDSPSPEGQIRLCKGFFASFVQRQYVSESSNKGKSHRCGGFCVSLSLFQCSGISRGKWQISFKISLRQFQTRTGKNINADTLLAWG